MGVANLGRVINSLLEICPRGDQAALSTKARALAELAPPLLAEFPNVARWKDTLGNLLLHNALKYKAPSDFVLKLIEIHPGACRERGFVVGYDALPLHVALRYRASTRVVLRLLELFPEAAEESLRDSNQTPLHLALWFRASDEVIFELLRLHPEAVFAENMHDADPLRFALRYRASTKVVMALLDLNPTAARRGEGLMYYTTALHVALRAGRDLAVLRRLMWLWPEAVTMRSISYHSRPIHLAFDTVPGRKVALELFRLNPSVVNDSRDPNGLSANQRTLLSLAAEAPGCEALVKEILDPQLPPINNQIAPPATLATKLQALLAAAKGGRLENLKLIWQNVRVEDVLSGPSYLSEIIDPESAALLIDWLTAGRLWEDPHPGQGRAAPQSRPPLEHKALNVVPAIFASQVGGQHNRALVQRRSGLPIQRASKEIMFTLWLLRRGGRAPKAQTQSDRISLALTDFFPEGLVDGPGIDDLDIARWHNEAMLLHIGQSRLADAAMSRGLL